MFTRIRIILKIIRDSFRYADNAELHGFAVGFNSFVNREKDEHILMLDFDVDDYAKVESSIRELIAFWNLSDCYVYKTKKGFHAFFYFDIMPYSRCRMIINYARDVDPLYKFISKYYDHKTIRVAGKYKDHDISFYKVVEGVRKPDLREVELGDLKKKEHAELLRMHEMLNKKRLK